MLALKRQLERLADFTGAAIAWLTVLMVVGTFVIVVLRYAFDLGWIAMQESITWIYRRLPGKRRALVDLAGTLIFLLPVSLFLMASSWDYVATSWAIHESSREAGGLPYPFVPILKSLIPATAVLLTLQGIANVLTAVLVATGRLPAEPDHAVPQGEVI